MWKGKMRFRTYTVPIYQTAYNEKNINLFIRQDLTEALLESVKTDIPKPISNADYVDRFWLVKWHISNS